MPPGIFHPHHLYVGLALPVDALAKAEGRKLADFPFVSLERGRLLLQALNLVIYVGDNSR